MQRAAEDASVLPSAAVDDSARMQIDARSKAGKAPTAESQLCSATYHCLLCAAADGKDVPSPSNLKRTNERAAAAAAVPGAFGAFNDVTLCGALIAFTCACFLLPQVASVLIDSLAAHCSTPSACLSFALALLVAHFAAFSRAPR